MSDSKPHNIPKGVIVKKTTQGLFISTNTERPKYTIGYFMATIFLYGISIFFYGYVFLWSEVIQKNALAKEPVANGLVFLFGILWFVFLIYNSLLNRFGRVEITLNANHISFFSGFGKNIGITSAFNIKEISSITNETAWKGSEYDNYNRYTIRRLRKTSSFNHRLNKEKAAYIYRLLSKQKQLKSCFFYFPK